MAMVEFKFDIGDKVYIADELKPEVAWSAKCYTVETVLYGESRNKYLLTGLSTGWIQEDRLVPASEAKNFAISNCASMDYSRELKAFQALVAIE